MIPFTAEVLLRLYGSYSLAIWPVPLAGYALGVLAVLLALRPLPGSGRAVAAILAAFWIWTGWVFHIEYFADLNWGAWIFGALFILQGLLLAWTGVIRGKLEFRFARDLRGWAGLTLVGLALASPALGAVAGHGWPQMQLPGTLPAPTTVITFGLLLMTGARAALPLAVIPFLWALIGGAAAATLGLWEDFSLIFSAALTIFALIASKISR